MCSKFTSEAHYFQNPTSQGLYLQIPILAHSNPTDVTSIFQYLLISRLQGLLSNSSTCKFHVSNYRQIPILADFTATGYTVKFQYLQIFHPPPAQLQIP
jgi:hypothetical protein